MQVWCPGPLGRHADHPLLQYLGRYLPAAVMLLLVIHTLKDVAFTDAPFGLHHRAGIAVTASGTLSAGSMLEASIEAPVSGFRVAVSSFGFKV